jgi:hypothetical protein
VKAPRVTNAAKSLKKVSISVSCVSDTFLYVRYLFLSMENCVHSGDWPRLVRNSLGDGDGDVFRATRTLWIAVRFWFLEHAETMYPRWCIGRIL